MDVNDVLNDGKSPAYVNGHMDKGHFQMAPDMDDEYGYGYVTYPSGLLYGSLSEQVGVAYQLKSDGTGYGIEFEFPLNAFTNDKDEALSIEAFQNLPQFRCDDSLNVFQLLISVLKSLHSRDSLVTK